MDKLLLVLGVGVWVVAGCPRISELLDLGPRPQDGLFIALYLAFVVAFLRARTTAASRERLISTVAQSASALALLTVGMPHFEGALLAVVGAQTLLVVPWSVALTWVVVQGVPLFLTVLPTHELLGATKATGEYLAFSVFAMTVFALREREREQRLALMQMQAELLGTRALLKDTVTAAEQSRIRRELHDSLGHHLAAASSHLDAVRTGSEPGLHLAQAREALDALVRESREVIRRQRPSVDPTEALSALKGAIPGVGLELDVKVLSQARTDVAWAAFRAVQEGLTNAHKHGRASKVSVRARRGDAGRLHLRIENDGGSGPRYQEGVGLGGMRARLDEVGGALSVDPGPPFALEITFERATDPRL